MKRLFPKKSHQILWITTDLLALILTSYLSYYFKFGQDKSTIMIFSIELSYISLLFLINFLWFLVITLSDTSKLNNFVWLNWQRIFKVSVVFFLFLGFASFSLKLSFSRMLFILDFTFGFLIIILGRFSCIFYLVNF